MPEQALGGLAVAFRGHVVVQPAVIGWVKTEVEKIHIGPVRVRPRRKIAVPLAIGVAVKNNDALAFQHVAMLGDGLHQRLVMGREIPAPQAFRQGSEGRCQCEAIPLGDQRERIRLRHVFCGGAEHLVVQFLFRCLVELAVFVQVVVAVLNDDGVDLVQHPGLFQPDQFPGGAVTRNAKVVHRAPAEGLQVGRKRFEIVHAPAHRVRVADDGDPCSLGFGAGVPPLVAEVEGGLELDVVEIAGAVRRLVNQIRIRGNASRYAQPAVDIDHASPVKRFLRGKEPGNIEPHALLQRQQAGAIDDRPKRAVDDEGQQGPAEYPGFIHEVGAYETPGLPGDAAPLGRSFVRACFRPGSGSNPKPDDYKFYWSKALPAHPLRLVFRHPGFKLPFDRGLVLEISAHQPAQTFAMPACIRRARFRHPQLGMRREQR